MAVAAAVAAVAAVALLLVLLLVVRLLLVVLVVLVLLSGLLLVGHIPSSANNSKYERAMHPSSFISFEETPTGQF
jgi:hypothetical protein